jgi:hypothetical protein
MHCIRAKRVVAELVTNRVTKIGFGGTSPKAGVDLVIQHDGELVRALRGTFCNRKRRGDCNEPSQQDPSTDVSPGHFDRGQPTISRDQAGLALSAPDSNTLRAAIESVLGDAELRRGARKVAGEIAALPTIESAVDALVGMAAGRNRRTTVDR